MEYKTESKVRVTLPEYIYNTILNDENDFEIKKNKLCNIIFKVYNEQVNFEGNDIMSKYSQILQFSLSNDNRDIYADIEKRYKIQSKADYFRKIFFLYSDLPKYKREILIFDENYRMINSAIKNKRKLKIKYQNEYRIVDPYFIKNTEGEARNYMFCYCNKHNEYRNYRLINIKAISIINEELEQYNEDYIRKIKNNFDPYLSYGNKVKIKLNDKGLKQFEKFIINKPKVLEKEENIYVLECSDFKAKLYFPQFMENVEILEPIELREWFKNKFKKVSDLYI